MDIVPNINKDNLSKERIEFLKKQDVIVAKKTNM